MDKEFNEYREKLKMAFSDTKEEKLSGYLIKGDISGIQEFIFNIPSRGAARLLKARSFFLQALVKLCIKKIQIILREGKVINDCGGSFYLQLDNEPDATNWQNLQKEINQPLIKYGLYISLVCEKLEDWIHTNKRIISKEEKLKYQRFNNLQDIFSAAQPTNFENEIEVWRTFAKNLANAQGFSLKPAVGSNHIYENRLDFYGLQFLLESEMKPDVIPFNSDNPSSFIMREMPKWRNNTPYYQEYIKQGENSEVVTWGKSIKLKEKEEYKEPKKEELIDLDHLGLQAKLRTGTDNLGILKLDVDNLGSMFREKFITQQQYKNASDAFSFFFGKQMHELWEKEIFLDKYNATHNYKDNIIIIYSGGDDCFILGAWDAVIEYSILIKTQFDNFVNGLAFREQPVSFSAGILLIDASYPIIRLGNLAEEMLAKAKNRKSKNAVCLFGEVFSWTELNRIKTLTSTLVELIQGNPEKKIEPESKALVQKIRLSARGYEALMTGVKTRKAINIQKVWNLTWFILRGVKKGNRELIDKTIVTQYHDAVLKALMTQEYSSALVYPVAARITELLTRKI